MSDSLVSDEWQKAAEPLLPYLGAVVSRFEADVLTSTDVLFDKRWFANGYVVKIRVDIRVGCGTGPKERVLVTGRRSAEGQVLRTRDGHD
jgi:hypothetical protein